MLEACLLETSHSSWRDTGKYSGPISLAIHGAAIALLLITGRVVVQHSPTIPKSTVLLMPDLSALVTKLSGGGGGGDRSPDPASVGRAPRFDRMQLAPPEAVNRAQDAALLVEPTLVGPPELQLPKSTLPMLGDPKGVVGPPSNGPGTRSGIGTGDHGGIGSGKEGGLDEGENGGFGRLHHPGVDGVSLPQVIYRVEPEFTDAARQAKHQGSVLIAIVVDADGHVRDPRIVTSLGLGLDERAIEAVKQWRFKPGMKDGHAVPVLAQVQVTFRLL